MSTIRRTRIKFCGLSRQEDVKHIVELGADAIGFVFYQKSSRSVTKDHAAHIARIVPPFISIVGLFVNATLDEIKLVTRDVPLTLLQFHGDETPEQCEAFGRAVSLPWLRAIRIGILTQPHDLTKLELHYSESHGLLFDSLSSCYGGSGEVFDWNIIPKNLASRSILSGGLNAQNVGEAIQKLHPFAVDVSSGVEMLNAKGIKDHAKIEEFIRAVRMADAQ